MHTPPALAALIYVGFVAWLFYRDIRQRPNVTGALWLPFIWVMVSTTRFLSQWLGIFGLNLGGTSVEEGSPLDAVLFFVVILSGVYVLQRRGVRLSEFVRNNRWVAIYLAYCFVAVLWSEYPFVATKRWFKLFGQPVMVLILLSEPDPIEAFIRLMKRCAYVIIPISILFIKYFPEYGRGFDAWSGLPMNTGITTNKNILGCDCFILALFFIWYLPRVWRSEEGRPRTIEKIFCLGLLAGNGWLLYMAHSSTSIACLVLSVGLMLFLGLKFVDVRRFSLYLVLFAVVMGVAELAFGLHKLVIEALGRDSTLTGRTDIWQILLHWDLNPIIGVGFESFWLGDERRDLIWRQLPGLVLNEAHNGYLETYIQIGLLGVFITLAMIVAAYFKSLRALLYNFEFGRFRLAYLAAFIVYNWTEAAFRTHCFPFFMFFLIAIDYPFERESAMVTSDTAVPDASEPEIIVVVGPENVVS